MPFPSSNSTGTSRLPSPERCSSLSASVLDEIEQIGSFLSSIESHFDQASNLAELGVFSSMFAHEVNNLMTQVGGRAQLALMNMDQPEMIVRALELACHASAQIAQLSEIFLEAADADSPHAGQFALSDIHKRAIEFIADHDIQAYGFTLDADVDDLKISAPPILLQQVLLNLYLNAIRAIEESTAPGPHQITTRVEQICPSENCSPWNTPRVRITVEDTGIGMDAQQIEQVFRTPLGSLSAQSSTKPNERGRGHGLGLSVCKKLLAQADGSIEAHSTLGKGTQMVITLPDADSGSKDSA